jgi:hypothetical protein
LRDHDKELINVAWIDALDTASTTATDVHEPRTQSREAEEEISDAAESIEAEEINWLPPRDSNPDMLIQSRHSADRESSGFLL